MIPVALRLRNFMSYGADAPVLDFDQFQVACLSGRNGQGKSALLDAITWVLWGEARKSAGGHKPDEELIRIGEREMQVDFVFDVEGERYRVIRSYRRTASGKTSRSELELHQLEAANGAYRPFTGASMRETQQHIDNVIGLDYNTFINSAFLLQGRSDEFTKKRPSERKEILARILNLSRYEQLHELAAGRERDARKAVEQAEHDIARLTKALEEEPVWKAERERIDEQIDEQRRRLGGLREEEKQLTERLAGLEARAREAERLRQAQEALQGRLSQHEQEARDLRARIVQAETHIAQREQIQRDHERVLELQKERDELDAKNELFRGIEKQIERQERALTDRKNDVERHLDRLQAEAKGHRQALADCDAQLVEKSSVQRKHEAALAAQRREASMLECLQQRQALDEEIRAAERTLVGEREALSGRVQALEEHIRQEVRAVPNLDRLEQRRATFQTEVARREDLLGQLKDTRDSGQAVAEDLKEHAVKRSARKEELHEKQEQAAYLRTGDHATCPTCGTELTAAHREEVEAQLEATIASLHQKLAREEQVLHRRNQERERLLEVYKRLEEQVRALEGAPERLAQVEEQLRSAQAARNALEEKKEEARDVRRQLDSEDYGGDLRERLRTLRRQREVLAFDEEAFAQTRTEAAQVARFEDRLRQLAEVEGRKEHLERMAERAEQELLTLRQTLDEGTALRAFQEEIQRLKGQLNEVGFDPQRFRAVKQALDEVGDAGARMTALVNAQQNHAEWKQRLAEVQARAQEAQQTCAQHATRRAVLTEELGEREGMEVLCREKAAARDAAEAVLHGLQVQWGQFSEKLEKAARDRQQQIKSRQRQAEAQAQKTRFKHLKTAFSRHGIPTLIIEQTLPDIEERTNELLERLTDGKMHIRLETLKDKKTGGAKETLEIKITDEQGVSRPYETFSGGEAFRVNFALRIALAQLLAERNGVRVRTLVIDEGFGTQDQQGIENLVEAIQTIQDDFDKIIVITHLPELKEVFPIRIEVEKDPVIGSRFEIIGV